ncbi:MAG: Crp/Fnr family transcriptional regulator [Chitinophagaceae bacterium]
MSNLPLARFLQSTNLVSSITADEIAGWFSQKLISKNHFFLQEGKIANEYLFLEKGFMRAFAFNTDGHDITTNFYSENQVVFEASSFFNRNRSKENIQAMEDCTGWFINYEQLNNLFHTLPEFREFGRSVLVKGLTQLKTRMLSLITETAEQRYDNLINTRPEIFHRAQLKHIASYLGITDTSLSRIRKEYSKK